MTRVSHLFENCPKAVIPQRWKHYVFYACCKSRLGLDYREVVGFFRIKNPWNNWKSPRSLLCLPARNRCLLQLATNTINLQLMSPNVSKIWHYKEVKYLFVTPQQSRSIRFLYQSSRLLSEASSNTNYPCEQLPILSKQPHMQKGGRSSSVL